MKLRLTLLLVLVLSATGLKSQEATAWRNGTGGIYPCTGLLSEWPEEGPEILWTFEDLGKGHSSPVISGDYLYVTGLHDGNGFLYKFDLKGKLVYKKKYGPEYDISFHGPRGTPVIVGDKIYYESGYGILMCLKESDASLIWKHDLVNDFGGDTITWGYNETPVIDGDVIYCSPGGNNSVMALNRFSGEIIWSCRGKGELTAYCTPLLFTHNGRKILTTHTQKHLLGIDAKTGKLLWAHPHPNQWSVHPNTPIYSKGKLFYFSGYGQGGGQISLSDDGTSIKQTWKTPLDSRMGGAVLIDGYIYGSGDQNRDWRCINWESGKDEWTNTILGKGVTIAADGKLYCYSDRGELAMVKVNPDKFELLAKTRVTKGSEQHWAHPIIHHGILYLRHGKALIAYKIK